MNLIGICGQSQAGKDLTTKITQTLIWIDNGEKLEMPIEEFVLTNGIFTPKGWRGFTNVYSKSGWQNKKFAGKLKEIVSILTGISVSNLEKQEVKEKELGEEWWYWKVYSDITNGKFELIPYKGERRFYNRKPNYKGHFLLKLTPRKLLQLLGTECGREIIHPNIWVNALFADYKPIYADIRKQVLEGTGQYPKWIISDVRFNNEVDAIKSRGGIIIKKLGKEINNSTHASETELLNYEADYTLNWCDDLTQLIEDIKQILIKEKIIECW